MPTTKLTKGVVDRLKPGPKDQFVWDSQDKGFGVKISPAGKITFIVQKRLTPTTAAIRITVGDYGVFTPDEAREVAREHLQAMRKGIDPRDVRRQEEARSITLREVADAYFTDKDLKESTRHEMDRHIETAFAKWKDRPIVSISSDECHALFEKLAAKGFRGKPAPSAPKLYSTTLRSLINYSMERYENRDGSPIIDRNPVVKLKSKMKPDEPRDRHIDRRQIGQFWNWLDDARAKAINADAATGIDLVKFLTLTGARRNEAATPEWRNVHIDDPNDCWWHIEDSKTTPISLPLSREAVDVLKVRKRLREKEETECPFVFPSRSKLGHVRDARAPLERFAHTIGMERLSAHDLRRTFITLGANAADWTSSRWSY
ncbi:integrase family protein [bacterium]|nr:integrase family protein [bacterium]